MKNKSGSLIVIFALVGVVAIYGTQIMEQITSVIASRITSDVEGVQESANPEKIDIIIDPGHGGPDPGKVGVNQALEKDLNLQIGKKVKALLQEKGYRIMMTREKDEAMKPQNEFSKVEDLSTRVELINKIKPKVVISVHQNSYSSESIKGAQVFYYKESQEALALAQLIQAELLLMDTDNTRQVKENDTYYLLKRTEVPTVIVECGFLSNVEEADKLIEEDYQMKIAQAIVDGIEKYVEGSN